MKIIWIIELQRFFTIKKNNKKKIYKLNIK